MHLEIDVGGDLKKIVYRVRHMRSVVHESRKEGINYGDTLQLFISPNIHHCFTRVVHHGHIPCA